MIHKVILMGNAGKDPEIRRMDNNLVFARFTLATDERWSKDGNVTEHTEWHNIIMWRGLAEKAEKFVRKGTMVYVEGRLRSRSYDDKDGIKRYVTEILADVMVPVEFKSDGGQSIPLPPAPQSVSTEQPPVVTNDLDSAPPDDLPF